MSGKTIGILIIVIVVLVMAYTYYRYSVEDRPMIVYRDKWKNLW